MGPTYQYCQENWVIQPNRWELRRHADVTCRTNPHELVRPDESTSPLPESFSGAFGGSPCDAAQWLCPDYCRIPTCTPRLASASSPRIRRSDRMSSCYPYGPKYGLLGEKQNSELFSPVPQMLQKRRQSETMPVIKLLQKFLKNCNKSTLQKRVTLLWKKTCLPFASTYL